MSNIPVLRASSLGSIIPELQNQVTHYDVTNQVTNSKILFFQIFRVSNLMWKNLNIILELLRKIKKNWISKLPTQKNKNNKLSELLTLNNK